VLLLNQNPGDTTELHNLEICARRCSAFCFIYSRNYGIAITFARRRAFKLFKTIRYHFANHVRRILDCWQWPSADLFEILCKVWSRWVAWFKSLFTDTQTQSYSHSLTHT